jgi:hypothetical protein
MCVVIFNSFVSMTEVLITHRSKESQNGGKKNKEAPATFTLLYLCLFSTVTISSAAFIKGSKHWIALS